MKKNLFTLSFFVLLFFLFYPQQSQAQNSNFATKLGLGVIIDATTPGFIGSIDYKIPEAPILLSPYFHYYSESGLGKQYFGADIQFTNQIGKGFYVGIGGGIARWSYEEYSRTSPSISPHLGVKISISNKVSLYTEGKMFVNTKTSQDTEDWNSGVLESGLLFDNDLIISGGFCILL